MAGSSDASPRADKHLASIQPANYCNQVHSHGQDSAVSVSRLPFAGIVSLGSMVGGRHSITFAARQVAITGQWWVLVAFHVVYRR